MLALICLRATSYIYVDWKKPWKSSYNTYIITISTCMGGQNAYRLWSLLNYSGYWNVAIFIHGRVVSLPSKFWWKMEIKSLSQNCARLSKWRELRWLDGRGINYSILLFNVWIRKWEVIILIKYVTIMNKFGSYRYSWIWYICTDKEKVDWKARQKCAWWKTFLVET